MDDVDERVEVGITPRVKRKNVQRMTRLRMIFLSNFALFR